MHAAALAVAVVGVAAATHVLAATPAPPGDDVAPALVVTPADPPAPVAPVPSAGSGEPDGSTGGTSAPPAPSPSGPLPSPSGTPGHLGDEAQQPTTGPSGEARRPTDGEHGHRGEVATVPVPPVASLPYEGGHDGTPTGTWNPTPDPTSEGR